MPVENIDNNVENGAEKDSERNVQSGNENEDDNEYIPRKHIDPDEKDSFLFNFTYVVKIAHYVRPILFSLLISCSLAWFVYVYLGLQDFVPEDSVEEGLGAGLMFAVNAAVFSFIIVFAVKKKGEAALKIIMSGAFLVLTFFLLLFYGDIFLITLSVFTPMTIEMYEILSNILIVIIGILAIYLIYLLFKDKMSKNLRNAYILMIGTLIGSFMATILPLWTSLTMLCLISIWDLISVKWKHGPIRKIMEMTSNIDFEMERKIKNGEVELDFDKEEWESSEINLGVGDIAFYSMLTSVCLLQTGSIFVALACAIGILIGAFITINALKNNKILPGLPLSIFIGLGLALITEFIRLNIL